MDIEREVGGVDCQVAPENLIEHSAAPTGQRLQSRPEEPVMNDEQIYAALDRGLDRAHGSIHGCADFCDRSGVLELKAIERIWPIVDFAKAQMLVGVGNDLGKIRHAPHCGWRDVLLHVPNSYSDVRKHVPPTRP